MPPKGSSDAKPTVDRSCRFCTKGAKKALRTKGHCNYKNKDFCMECGVHKKEAHLCAFADLPRKLSVANGAGHGGQPIPGAAGAKDPKQKQKQKPSAGQSKREADLAKENAELKKQLGLNTNDGQTVPKGAAVEDKSAEQVAKWRKYSNSHAASLKHAREEFVDEGADDDEKAKRGI